MAASCTRGQRPHGQGIEGETSSDGHEPRSSYPQRYEQDKRVKRYRRDVPDNFTLIDQSGKPWTLSDHLDAAAMLVFLRGDW